MKIREKGQEWLRSNRTGLSWSPFLQMTWKMRILRRLVLQRAACIQFMYYIQTTQLDAEGPFSFFGQENDNFWLDLVHWSRCTRNSPPGTLVTRLTIEPPSRFSLSRSSAVSRGSKYQSCFSAVPANPPWHPKTILPNQLDLVTNWLID